MFHVKHFIQSIYLYILILYYFYYSTINSSNIVIYYQGLFDLINFSSHMNQFLNCLDEYKKIIELKEEPVIFTLAGSSGSF